MPNRRNPRSVGINKRTNFHNQKAITQPQEAVRENYETPQGIKRLRRSGGLYERPISKED